MRLMTVQEFSKIIDVRLPRAYELARRLPPGVRVALGRQIRINEDALTRWLEAGGTLFERPADKTESARANNKANP
jgi:hypothetical protein